MSEEEEIIKKEREIIEIMEKEEKSRDGGDHYTKSKMNLKNNEEFGLFYGMNLSKDDFNLPHSNVSNLCFKNLDSVHYLNVYLLELKCLFIK